VPQPFGGFPDKFVLASVAGEPKAGEVRKFEVAAGVFLEFCYVPKSKGKATLGSPETEKERSTDEKEHGYEEKSGFWLGKFAVTQGEWTGVMGTTPFYFCKDGVGKEKVAGLNTDRFPAETVSWEDAQDFLGKLNGRSGVAKAFGAKAKFVLPHENRWEYAYRGGLGNKRAFYWGDELNGDEANCNGNYPFGTPNKGDYKRRTTAVGEYESKAKHPWGLCDMSGNVYQRCENKYSNDSTSRVLRGGSWDNSARSCRAAYRSYGAPAHRNDNVGFRVCVALD